MPPAPQPDAPRRRSRTALILAVALAVVAFAGGFGIAAVAGRDRGRSTAANGSSPSTVPSTTTPTTSAASNDASSSLLPRIGVQQSDVPADVTVQLVPGGSGLGDPTLDLCQATFPSESLRTARFQRVAVDSQGTVPVQTEAVLYKDVAAATQAMTELTQAKASCPATPRTDVLGTAVTTKFNAAPDAGWAPAPAGIQRLAFDFVETDSTGGSMHVVEVFYRRGRALLGVYYSLDNPQTTVTGQSGPEAISNVFAQRLAQLPAAAIGA